MIPQRVEATDRGQEIAGDQLIPLVDQLIESVLAVGPRLPPDDRAGRIVDGLAIDGHRFAVALHITLLKIGGEAMQRLVIGEDGVRLGTIEVIVPDAEQGHDDRDVLFKGGFCKMLVGPVSATEQFFEIIHADIERDRQADCRPERIASADPVPEFKHIVRVDAELDDLVTVGRNRHEVAGDGCLIPSVFPAASCVPNGRWPWFPEL